MSQRTYRHGAIVGGHASELYIFAAGDVTGGLMLVPQAIQSAFVAATNSVRGVSMMLENQVSPIGSFTDPEYAQVGLTEVQARQTHNIVMAVVHFDSTTRTIIDGRTTGFCKLIVERSTCRILGCHAVGERGGGDHSSCCNRHCDGNARR